MSCTLLPDNSLMIPHFTPESTAHRCSDGGDRICRYIVLYSGYIPDSVLNSVKVRKKPHKMHKFVYVIVSHYKRFVKRYFKKIDRII